MIAFLLKLALGSLNGVRSAFTWLFADARRWMGALIVLIALYALHERNGWNKCEADGVAYKAAVAKASADNRVAQAKLLADQKAKFDASAEKTDALYETELANARSAADRYKLAHRVPASNGGIGAAASPAQGDAAGVPETTPADAELVAVTGADIDACTTDYVNAKAAYDWGQDLVSKGVAEFGSDAPQPPAP